MDYLDETEKRVVEYCQKNNIPFKFSSASSKWGVIHHFDFSRLIDFNRYESGYGMMPDLFEARKLRAEAETRLAMMKQAEQAAEQAKANKWWRRMLRWFGIGKKPVLAKEEEVFDLPENIKRLAFDPEQSPVDCRKIGKSWHYYGE